MGDGWGQRHFFLKEAGKNEGQSTPRKRARHHSNMQVHHRHQRVSASRPRASVEFAIACPTPSKRRLPSPVLIPAEVAGRHLVPLLSIRDAVSVACASTCLRDFVQSAFTHLPPSSKLIAHGDDDVAALMRFIRYRQPSGLALTVHNLTDVGLALLGQARAPALHLDAARNFRLTDAGLHSLIACCDLQALDLSGAWRVTDDALALIGTKLARLKALSLARCYRVTDAGVRHLCGLVELERIDLSRCVNVHHEATLAELALACPLLRAVALSGLAGLVTVYSLSALAVAGRVEELDIEGASFASDGAVAQLESLVDLKAARCAGLVSCANWRLSRLRSLDLSGAASSMVDEASLQALAVHSPRLETLCMRNTAVSSAGLGALAALELRTLDVSGCANVDDDGLARLNQGCSVLVSLNLSGCKSVTPTGARALLSPRLRNLVLPPTADDALLVSISRLCILLENLDAGRSPTVGDAGVVAVVRRLRRLRTLRVDETSITDVSLAAIAASAMLDRLTAYSCVQTSSSGWRQVLHGDDGARSVALVMDSDGTVWPAPPSLDAAAVAGGKPASDAQPVGFFATVARWVDLVLLLK